jgi:alanine racemase
MPRSWVEISKSSLLENYSSLSKYCGSSTRLAPVLKANAYGHGLSSVASILNQCDSLLWYCVDSIEEALEIRATGYGGPVLIMGWIPFEDFHRLDSEMRVCAYSLKMLKQLETEKLSLKVHLKLETGLNRQGVKEGELPDLLNFLQSCQYLSLEAFYTHYANVEDTLNPDFFKEQLFRFNKMKELFPSIPMWHTCASAAALLYPEARGSLCRCGISLYGYHASWKTYLSLKERGCLLQLKPVLNWKTRIAQLKDVQPGDTVGYGRTREILSPARIAILPVGYYDGYCRSFGNQGSWVILNGRRAPVMGRVAMNMMMVEVTHIPGISVGDEVVLLGSQGDLQITAEELAEYSGTIHYEVLTGISPHLPRIEVP